MKIIALDTETWFVEERHGPNGTITPPLVCTSWWLECENGSAGFVRTKEDSYNELFYYLTDSNFRFVGHNIAFDLAVICREWPELLEKVFVAYEQNRVTDTMLREKLLDIASGSFTSKGYSLKALALKHLEEKLEKEDTWRLRYKELDGKSLAEWPNEAVNYALKDAEATYDVFFMQEKFAYLLKDQYRQARAAFWMHLMSAHGIMTDPDRVEELEVKAEERLAQDRDLLVEHGLVERVYK